MNEMELENRLKKFVLPRDLHTVLGIVKEFAESQAPKQTVVVKGVSYTAFKECLDKFRETQEPSAFDSIISKCSLEQLRRIERLIRNVPT